MVVTMVRPGWGSWMTSVEMMTPSLSRVTCLMPSSPRSLSSPTCSRPAWPMVSFMA